MTVLQIFGLSVAIVILAIGTRKWLTWGAGVLTFRSKMLIDATIAAAITIFVLVAIAHGYI